MQIWLSLWCGCLWGVVQVVKAGNFISMDTASFKAPGDFEQWEFRNMQGEKCRPIVMIYLRSNLSKWEGVLFHRQDPVLASLGTRIRTHRMAIDFNSNPGQRRARLTKIARSVEGIATG